MLGGEKWIRTRGISRRIAYRAGRDTHTTKIGHREFGLGRVRHALPQTSKPFRIAELPASIGSPPLVANAEFSPQPREVVGAHRILGTLR